MDPEGRRLGAIDDQSEGMCRERSWRQVQAGMGAKGNQIGTGNAEFTDIGDRVHRGPRIGDSSEADTEAIRVQRESCQVKLRSQIDLDVAGGERERLDARHDRQAGLIAGGNDLLHLAEQDGLLGDGLHPRGVNAGEHVERLDAGQACARRASNETRLRRHPSKSAPTSSG